VMESNFGGLLESAHVDFAPTTSQPIRWRYALAIVLAVGLSLSADAALVHAGIALFPSTRGFSHFRFSDYATLTGIAVIVACAGWPLVIRISSAPRWLFLRAAVVVTLVAWAPDVWLVAKGEPARAVAVLAVMHLAVAAITYNVLVHVAPPRSCIDEVESTNGAERRRVRDVHTRLRPWWVAMTSAITLEFILGVIAIVTVPVSRPTGWIPDKGKFVFALHGALGVAALLGACALVAVARRDGRIPRIASIGGLVGVLLGGAGGLLAVDHGLRLAGMGVMFVASGISFFAYLVPLIEPAHEARSNGSTASEEGSDPGDEAALT
jgi:hypothetical protein